MRTLPPIYVRAGINLIPKVSWHFKNKKFIYEFLVGDYTSKPNNKYFDKELSESYLLSILIQGMGGIKNNLDEEASLISKKKITWFENNLNQLEKN